MKITTFPGLGSTSDTAAVHKVTIKSQITDPTELAELAEAKLQKRFEGGPYDIRRAKKTHQSGVAYFAQCPDESQGQFAYYLAIVGPLSKENFIIIKSEVKAILNRLWDPEVPGFVGDKTTTEAAEIKYYTTELTKVLTKIGVI